MQGRAYSAGVTRNVSGDDDDGDYDLLEDFPEEVELQLDPDDDAAEEKIKQAAENKAAKEVAAALAEQHAETMAMLGIPAGKVGAEWTPPPVVTTAATAPATLANQLPSAGLQSTLGGVMGRASTLGVKTAADTLAGAGIGVNWQLANAQAGEWAKSYTFDLVKGINETSAQWLGEKVNGWIESGKPLVNLQKELEIIWSKNRADMIAVTEVTRAYARGSLTVYQGVPGIEQVVWRTAINDVCPVCRPMHGERGDMAGRFAGGLTIPAHVRCRCWIAPVVEKAKVAALLPKPAPPAPVVVAPVVVPKTINDLPALNVDMLNTMDFHSGPSEPTWANPQGKLSYGGIIFDEHGRMLLRKPTGNFDGYAWTWPKGKANVGDTPADTALREVEEETGWDCDIISVLPGTYKGGTGQTNFFVMRGKNFDKSKMDWETEDTQWASYDEAKALIAQSTNQAGKKRDLEVLETAYKTHQQLLDNEIDPITPSLPKDPDEDDDVWVQLGAKDWKSGLAPKVPAPVYQPVAPPVAPSMPAPPKPVAPPKAKTPKPVVSKPPVVVQPGKAALKENWPKAKRIKAPTNPLKPAELPAAQEARWKAPSTAKFPDDPEKLTLVRRLGGSTGAELVKDKNGKLFVRKRGASPEHLQEEVYSDGAYQALGVRVPAMKLYTGSDGKPIKLAEFVEGQTLGELRNNPAAYKTALRKIQGNMAADALLGNRDAVGAAFDNVLIDTDGEVWRIDNGGGLRFRGMGGRKTDEEWDGNVSMLWSLRDPQFANNHAVYSGVEYTDVLAQMKQMTTPKQRKALLAALPDELHATMNARLDQMQRLVETGETLLGDQYRPEYVDTFNKHQVGLSKAGLVQRMPKTLAPMDMDTQIPSPPHSQSMTVYDEHGKPFDDLRGVPTYDQNGKKISSGSITDGMFQYMSANGGSPNLIYSWAHEQGGNSWNSLPQAGKIAVMKQRSVGSDAYFWSGGVAEAEKHYKNYAKQYGGESVIDNSMAILHAYSYELIDRVDMPQKNEKTRTIHLLRTEGDAVLRIHGVEKGTPNAYKRGAVESTSIFQDVRVFGDNMVEQDVPYHRVIGTYMMERADGEGRMFLGDGENEFVVMLEGIDGTYTRKVR